MFGLFVRKLTIPAAMDLLPIGRQEQVLAICDAVGHLHPQWSRDHQNSASLLITATLASATYDRKQLVISPGAIRRLRQAGKNAAGEIGSVGLEAIKRTMLSLFLEDEKAGMNFSYSPDVIRFNAGIFPLSKWDQLDKEPVA